MITWFLHPTFIVYLDQERTERVISCAYRAQGDKRMCEELPFWQYLQIHFDTGVVVVSLVSFRNIRVSRRVALSSFLGFASSCFIEEECDSPLVLQTVSQLPPVGHNVA